MRATGLVSAFAFGYRSDTAAFEGKNEANEANVLDITKDDHV